MQLCEKNGIDLLKLFQNLDHYNTELLDRLSFEQVLHSLPFGLLDEEIAYITQNYVSYDGESGKIKYKNNQED